MVNTTPGPNDQCFFKHNAGGFSGVCANKRSDHPFPGSMGIPPHPFTEAPAASTDALEAARQQVAEWGRRAPAGVEQTGQG